VVLPIKLVVVAEDVCALADEVHGDAPEVGDVVCTCKSAEEHGDAPNELKLPKPIRRLLSTPQARHR
jgi:hypothetical protein